MSAPAARTVGGETGRRVGTAAPTGCSTSAARCGSPIRRWPTWPGSTCSREPVSTAGEPRTCSEDLKMGMQLAPRRPRSEQFAILGYCDARRDRTCAVPVGRHAVNRADAEHERGPGRAVCFPPPRLRRPAAPFPARTSRGFRTLPRYAAAGWRSTSRSSQKRAVLRSRSFARLRPRLPRSRSTCSTTWSCRPWWSGPPVRPRVPGTCYRAALRIANRGIVDAAALRRSGFGHGSYTERDLQDPHGRRRRARGQLAQG